MKLIVNADDFGFSEGVNRGIVEAYKNGIVTSCSVMMTMPALTHAKVLAQKNPELKLGLHLNMTLGRPLTNCISLIKENGFFYKPKEKPDINKFLKSEIKIEFLAQYKKFISEFKRKPTHLDTHLYAHQIYGVVKEVISEISEEKNIPVRDLDTPGFKKAYFIDWFKVCKNETEDAIWLRFEENKQLILSQEIAELMVHPAWPDNYLCKHSSYNKQRLIELKILTSDKIKKFIKENKIILTDFEEETLWRK